MSRRRGTQHHKRRQDRIGAVVYACCATEADIPEARQRAHDQVIEMAGRSRLSGVRWEQWPSLAGFRHLQTSPVIASMGEGAGPGQYDVHMAFLRGHPDGYLVAAIVDVKYVHSGRVTR